MNYPGINQQSFVMKLSDVFFKKGDTLTFGGNTTVKVVKVYKYNIWRKFLNFFGIKFKLFNCIKVKL